MNKSNKKCYAKLIFSIFALSISQLALSQVLDKNAPPLEVDVTLLAVDNFNPTLNEKINAGGVIFAPKGKLVSRGEGFELMFDYGGSFTQYQLGNEVNTERGSETFVDYRAGFLGRIYLGDAWSLDAKLVHDKKQQVYGYGLSKLRTQVVESDEVSHNKGALSLVYGQDRSSRMIALEFISNDYSYANNNDYASLFSYSQQTVTLNTSFRHSAATAWLVRIEASEDDFDSIIRNDSRVYRAMVGVNWQFTGRSGVEVLLGTYKRDVKNQDSNSGLSWALDYHYQPREDFKISLSSSRLSVVGESELADDSVKSDVNMSVTYLFSQQWQLGLNLVKSNTEFEETAGSRELDEQSGAIKLGLSISSHNNVDLILSNRKVSTSDNAIDYSQNEASLKWRYQF